MSSAVSLAIQDCVQKLTPEIGLGDDSTYANFQEYQTPPDGLCLYHSIWGALHFDEFSQIARNSSGFALNRRLVQSESERAMDLRSLVISMHVGDNAVLGQLAESLKQKLSVDICELPLVGQALNLAIRCTIAPEAQAVLKRNVRMVLLLQSFLMP